MWALLASTTRHPPPTLPGRPTHPAASTGGPVRLVHRLHSDPRLWRRRPQRRCAPLHAVVWPCFVCGCSGVLQGLTAVEASCACSAACNGMLE